MNADEWLVKQFEGYRTHLRAVAYRMPAPRTSSQAAAGPRR